VYKYVVVHILLISWKIRDIFTYSYFAWRGAHWNLTAKNTTVQDTYKCRTRLDIKDCNRLLSSKVRNFLLTLQSVSTRPLSDPSQHIPSRYGWKWPLAKSRRYRCWITAVCEQQEKPHPTPRVNYSWPTKSPLVPLNLGEFIDTTDAKQALVVETLIVIYVLTRKRHTKGTAHGVWA